MLPQWLTDIELQEAEQTQRLLQQEIAELEAQRTISVERQQSIRENKTILRNRSRRMTSNTEGRTQALIEIDSFIATVNLKLDQKRRHLQAANVQIRHLTKITDE